MNTFRLVACFQHEIPTGLHLLPDYNSRVGKTVNYHWPVCLQIAKYATDRLKNEILLKLHLIRVATFTSSVSQLTAERGLDVKVIKARDGQFYPDRLGKNALQRGISGQT